MLVTVSDCVYLVVVMVVWVGAGMGWRMVCMQDKVKGLVICRKVLVHIPLSR